MELFKEDNILTGDEINSLFETPKEETEVNTEDEKPNEEKSSKEGKASENEDDKETAEVDVESLFERPESVGSDKEESGKEKPKSEKEGSSTYIYSSIAKALKEEGILPDLEDEVVDGIANPEDFAKAIEQQIQSKFDERQKRIDEALSVGVDNSEIKKYEDALAYLNSITDNKISDDSDDGENLRKQLIFQDYLNRGFSKERAQKEVKKSFDAGTDIEDANDALKSNKEFFNKEYKQLIKKHKDIEEEERNEIKKEEEKFKKSIFESKEFFGNEINDDLRKRIYDNIAKPTWKDPDTGEILTAIQKYERTNRADFLRYLGYFYTVTNGFKSFDGVINSKIKRGVSKGLKDLEATLNNTQVSPDGNLNFMGSSKDTESFFSKYDLDV